jgi:glucosylceramidase
VSATGPFMAAIFVTLAATVAASDARAQSIDVYVSARSGERLAHRAPLEFGGADAGPAQILIDDQVELQKMIGFGASFLEAGMIGLNSLPPSRQEQVLQSLFDVHSGAGFSAMKTVIGLTDFMSAGPPYSYDETPGDLQLKHFSIERDLGPDGLVTYIKRARRHGSFVLQATMDYPPDWMLINVDVQKDQNVDPKFYDALSRYYLRYLQEYEKQGIVIDYLSPFNEPGSYTKITYPQIRELIKNHLGPQLVRSGLKTRLQVSDAPFRSFARHQMPLILDDPEARKYIASISYHGYDYRFRQSAGPDNTLKHSPDDLRDAEPTLKDGYRFDEFREVAELKRMYPELPMWMTETCYFDMKPSLKAWQPALPRYDFDDGEFWGLQIAADIEAGASGWTYWNMILDQNGGPPLVSPKHHDPAVNVQHPVVIINRETQQVTYTGLYYYLAHFSKFVRPGAHRVKTTGAVDGVTVLAFKSEHGKLVVQAINSRNTEARVELGWRRRRLTLVLPSHSISTYLWNGSN